MQERVGLKSLVKNTQANLPYWIEQAPHLPGLLHNSLQKLSQADFNQQSKQIEQLEQQMAKQSKAQRNRFIGALLLIPAVFPVVLAQFGWLNPAWLPWLQALFGLTGLYLILKKT